MGEGVHEPCLRLAGGYSENRKKTEWSYKEFMSSSSMMLSAKPSSRMASANFP